MVSYKVTAPCKDSETHKDKYKNIVIYNILLVPKQN